MLMKPLVLATFLAALMASGGAFAQGTNPPLGNPSPYATNGNGPNAAAQALPDSDNSADAPSNSSADIPADNNADQFHKMASNPKPKPTIPNTPPLGGNGPMDLPDPNGSTMTPSPPPADNASH
jgi:hypothetical protein